MISDNYQNKINYYKELLIYFYHQNNYRKLKIN
jgi:hypothetical protein